MFIDLSLQFFTICVFILREGYYAGFIAYQFYVGGYYEGYIMYKIFRFRIYASECCLMGSDKVGPYGPVLINPFCYLNITVWPRFF